ncbi:hypothetical protein HW35_15520 [Bacillus sp. X1(2014)]|nr:hypothetical protein HW35_15520 [Bacillus sp. X1(2014)]
MHHKIKRTTKQLQLKKKQKPAEAKSDFGFTLNKFIDEYNKQIDNGIYDSKKKIPSHLQIKCTLCKGHFKKA